MEKDLNDSVVQNSSYLKESETDKSFVGKFKSIINNTPLSKWFRKQDVNRSTIRRRDEIFEDEDICEMQPPSKRVKLPGGNEESNCNNVLFNETRNIPVTNNINITNKTFNSFSEPVAGPSGIKSRKLLNNTTTASTSSARNTFSSNELLNGHKDSDSEESTSGYSSVARIGSKEQVCGSQESSKQTSPLQNSPSNSRSLFHTPNASTTRSLFAERSLSPNMNTSLSSRRPSFNASTFGSPNFVDKTISTKRIINSPFYNGQTIYGGASAYGRRLGRSSQDLKKSLRKSVQIKPVNKTTENVDLVLGKTARRILDTLEQYSSPINDAKKIPLTPKKLRHDGLLTKYTGANPYMVRESKGTSNKELQVPSVSDLLKMKHKTRLQNSTEAVRKIAISSKSDLNSEYYNINLNENEKEKHTGKIKTKIASVRQRQPINETIDEVKLNPVPLPITTLPKFDFIIPPRDQNKKVPENPSQPIKQVHSSPTSESTNAQPSLKIVETEKNVQIEKQTTTSTLIEYKFSDPLVIAENMKSVVAINDFKFSEPHCKKSKTDSNPVDFNFKMPENKLPSLIPKKTKNDMETSVKPATMLKTGSVMDILGKKDNDSLMEKFKPAEGTWECSSCMIRNQPDKTKCVACETPKLIPTTQAEKKEGFGNQFKLSSDKWECSVCMVRNNNSDNKCVACTTSKPNTNATPKDLEANNAPLSGFGDKFKPSSNYWNCTVCFIQNKIELTKCAACENPKLAIAETPSANFDDKFKPPPNSWECTSCLVRNKEEASKCVACETPKSGQKSLKSAGFGDSFKVKDDEWECAVCMVRNKVTNTKCQCCDVAKPGSTTTNSSALEINDKKPIPTFNFGIDKAAAASFSFGIPSTAATSLIKTVTNVSSIFGQTAAVTPAAPATFSFGIPPETQNKPKENESAKPTEPTKTPVLQIDNAAPKTVDKPLEKSEPPQSGFKFGVSTPSVPVSNKEVTAEKSDTVALSTASTSNSDATKPTFNFKPTTANGDVNKSGLFGNKQETTSGTSLKPTTVASTNLFNFGAKPAATATPLTSTPATQSSQTVSAKPLFNFGSSSHSTVKSTTPSFGSVNSSGTSLNNGFATTNTPSFGTTSTSSFETPITNSSEVKPFTFTSTTTSTGEPANKVSMFSFGQSAGSAAATTSSAKTTGFNFTSSSTPTFNFTGGKTETPSFNAPANNIFGVVTSNPGKNGTFNFGSMASSNNNQKAGFSFGAAINNTTAPSTQPSFGFGGTVATATPVPSSGGFNFTGAPPTFNATAKPSFNFTDGTTTAFSAQPPTDGGLAAAPRKIKRAVRRTQR